MAVKRLSEAERFWAKVDKTPGCWLWRACTTKDGYGRFAVNSTLQVRAHRWAFEEVNGLIAPGLDIDHTCHVRSCVNPAHLQAVTRGENAQNRNGASRTSSTGVRGVSYDSTRGKYRVRVVVNGRFHRGASFETLAAAAQAAANLRRQLMPNSLLDHASDPSRPQGPNCGDPNSTEWRLSPLGA